MQAGGHDIIKRWVRIGAIALVILGALLFAHDHARAQLGIDVLRQAVDQVKDKAKSKQIPGKDLLKGKKADQKGAGDLVKGRLKDKGGLEKAARDKLTKDRFSKENFSKEKFSKEKFSKEGIGKDKGFRDKLTKDKDKGIAKDKIGKDKSIAKEKDGVKDKSIAKDANDKGAKDRIAKDKVGKDKLAQDKLGKDKLGKDKLGKDRSALDNAGKGRRDILSSKKANAVPDKRAMHRISKARTPIERGQLRIGHGREIFTARLRLPQRPFPGAPGFTGVPPTNETRFVSTEMVFHVGPNVSRAAAEAAWKRHGMVVVAEQPSPLTGGTIFICRVPAGVQVAAAVRAMEAERIGTAQPSYVFRIVQDTASDTQSAPGSPDQYVIEKLQLPEVHKVATGREILVAVIDSKVDSKHPDLAHAIAEEYDAVGRPEAAHSHGTGMTGAIVSYRKLLGIAPNAKILAVHAFSTSTRQAPEATTRQIIAGIEWAINKGARVINMSFAGPYDPMIQVAMRNAHNKGVILIAASGNMGAKSPPLYPAADPHVIAVTATDESDELFPQAVRGPHLAVAAPGVDVVVPAPDDSYQLTTGTSVAAAHVSGVAALLMERHPDADAKTILEVLTATARNLNPKGRDDQFGWGLIDPAAALQELDSRIADGKALATAKASPPKATPKKAVADKAPTQKTATPPKAATPRPAAVRTSPAP